MDDLEFWRGFNRRFDPFRRLEADEIGELYAGIKNAPADVIAEEIEFGGRPEQVRLVLAGARGCGKTTELVRTYGTLARGSTVLPLYVDLGEALPKSATTITWLPVLAAALRAAVQDWEGESGSREPGELGAALEQIGVGGDAFAQMLSSVGALAVWSPPEVSGALAAVSTAGALLGKGVSQLARFAQVAKTTLSGVHATRHEDAVTRLVGALRAEVERLTAACGRPPALLLDGLDRLPPLDNVFAALDDADLLSGLPAAMVLSGPAQAMFDRRHAALTMGGGFRPIAQYNLPIVTHDGSANEEGVAVLRGIFDRRAKEHEAHASRTLAMFPRPILDEAARMSSGLVREFLEIVRQTAGHVRRAGAATAEPTHLDEAVRTRRHDYERVMRADDWRMLDQVLRTREPPEREVDELLFHNILACYQNHHVWYRPNELLIPYAQARRQRIETERPGGTGE